MSSRPSRGAARLAAILDALPDALLLVNCNGTVVNANAIALETFEAPGTALVGRGLLDLLPAFDSKLIPGSMRRPEDQQRVGVRTKPTRMVARRTDGTAFLVEVTSANLEDARTPYESSFEAAFADHGPSGYTGDELLMLVVRDLTGTQDAEAELARQQRQTEMILRAAAEGVVGVDTEGRVVLVNPAAAQILGYRASDLGGQQLHPLIHHSRADGSPLPYEETPLADTLRSGRKHRVRGQVLWTKDGRPVPVDLTTAPVRGSASPGPDGSPGEEHLVGAVLTFTDRRPYDALAARHEQLLAVLGESLRGPLEQLRGELGGLAADPAGQLWPEANQVLHHLAAGYSRMTTLIDNVLSYQRLDSGREKLSRASVPLDEVVPAAVEGAVELIGPGRAQFAVHAPPIEAEVDPEQLALALAHLIADVAGVDSTGNAPAGGGTGDSTIVVAAAQRGEVIRIEVRGPYPGGDPVHAPIVQGIVQKHGGVLQAHQVPGSSGGSTFVLEVPVSQGGSGAQPARPGRRAASASPSVSASGNDAGALAQGASADGTGGAAAGTSGAGTQPGRRQRTDATAMPAPARPAPGDTDSGAISVPPAGPSATAGAAPAQTPMHTPMHTPVQTPEAASGSAQIPAPGGDRQTPHTLEAAGPGRAEQPRPTGRRRGRPSPAEAQQEQTHWPSPGSESGTADGGTGSGGTGSPAGPAGAAANGAVPGPVPSGTAGVRPALPQGGRAVSAATPAPEGGAPLPAQLSPQVPVGEETAAAPEAVAPGTGRRARRARPAEGSEGRGLMPASAAGPAPMPQAAPQGTSGEGTAQTGRRARRALAQGQAPEQVRGTPGAGTPVDAAQTPPAGTGRRARRPVAQPPAPAQPSAQGQGPAQAQGSAQAQPHRAEHRMAPQTQPEQSAFASGAAPLPAAMEPNGQQHSSFALPPAAGDRGSGTGSAGSAGSSGALPLPQPAAPVAPAAPAAPAASAAPAARSLPEAVPSESPAEPAPGPAMPPVVAGSPILSGAAALPPARSEPGARAAQEAGTAEDTSGGISVRTLGQGVPFARQAAELAAARQDPRAGAGATAGAGYEGPYGTRQPSVIPTTQSSLAGSGPAGSGRRRKLAAPSEAGRATAVAQQTPPQPIPTGAAASAVPAVPPQQQPPQLPQQQSARPTHAHSHGREFAIGAPDAGAAEGPEPLDGPNGAVEVTEGRSAALPAPEQRDAELPPEPLDNPRRLLVWPEPDVSTQQALTDRGYRPVIVHSREDVDAQMAAYPAALFVDPLTGPITRTALQSLRTAAVAAEVPVLVTAGLGQASREAAYGADPAVLLKALAPRDSEQHPPRVLLVEEHPEIAQAFASSLERRGMQVAHAPTDAESMAVAAQVRPNLVVMDLMQIRRRRAGIVDWLRVNDLLNRTPFVVYTSATMDPAEYHRLASGETVLFLAERSTSDEVQARIVDLLAKIGAS